METASLIVKLKRYKKDTKKSWEDIAREVGVTHNSMVHWVNGRNMSKLSRMAIERFFSDQGAKTKAA